MSRFPLVIRRVGQLPGNGAWYCRETRAALWAEAETNLGPIQIVTTHFGLGRVERLRQAEMLVSAEWLAGVPNETPLVLLGDFNSIARGRTCRFLARHLRDAGSLRTYPTLRPTVAIDHIFTNAALRSQRIHVFRNPLARVASDHYPLVAELKRSPVSKKQNGGDQD